MADTDVLDMLFDTHSSSILGVGGVGIGQDQLSFASTLPLPETTTGPAMTLNDNEIDWDSLLDGGLEQHDLFKDLMDTNLSDDLKEKQLFPKTITDHAYSAHPGSPHSDSGISNGPVSPSNSSNSFDNDAMPLDIEQELFGPLNLDSYQSTQLPDVDPMLLNSWVDSESSSPEFQKHDSEMSFDFGDLIEKSPSQPVSDLTISTDEMTKVIKVLSVNSNSRKSQSLLSMTNSTTNRNGRQTSPKTVYPELVLSDEEKDLLRKEGISLPSHAPLTREEEKILRSVRRRIRNKASARNSRRKKQDYMEALEERVKLCTEEKRQLEKKVNALEKQNSSLIGQLRKLQKMVSDSTRQTAKAGTCAMILAVSFALVVLPSFQSFIGGSSAEEILVKSPAGGRPSRSLLSKPEDILNTDSQDEVSTNYLPFFNLNKMVSLVTPAKQMVEEPLDGLEKPYVHDAVDGYSPGENPIVGSKVLHMEITQLPENPLAAMESPGIPSVRNNDSSVDVKPINPDQIIRHRSIRMDLDDEL